MGNKLSSLMASGDLDGLVAVAGLLLMGVLLYMVSSSVPSVIALAQITPN